MTGTFDMHPRLFCKPSRVLALCTCCLGALLGAVSHAQSSQGTRGTQILSATGYTGAINTPTAGVLDWGNAALALSNSNPEVARSFRQGSFGSLNMGVGVLPGLEVVGRLSYDGDLNCNAYTAACFSRSRDLSVSSKYQLPLTLWNNTRLAIGMTDFGGAATNYRQSYAVATSPWNNAEFSLGYSQNHSTNALLKGPFASVRYSMTPQWQLLAEHDSQQGRAGLQYQLRLGERLDLLGTYSRKWSQNTAQQAHQMQWTLHFHLDQNAAPQNKSSGQTSDTASPNLNSSRPTAAPIDRVNGENMGRAKQWPEASLAPIVAATEPPPPQQASLVLPPPPLATATEMAELLKQQGFAHIAVHYWPETLEEKGLWQISAEPRAFRQSQIEATGQALRPWLALVRKQRIAATDHIHLTLTYQREPVLYAQVQAGCLKQWVEGVLCESSTDNTALTLSPRALPRTASQKPRDPSAVQTAHASAGASWAPQFTLSPALRNTVGTEYGLLDYSLAAQIGAEVHLAPGLFWQGIYVVPVSHSDDYQAGEVFGESRFDKPQWHSSQLTYWKPLMWGLSAQVSGGQLTPSDRGSQFDAIWMSPEGRWRLGWTTGRYRSTQIQRLQLPQAAQVRYSVMPGLWHIEATGGQFMGGDEGVKLASLHWFGDTRFALHYQKTGSPIFKNMPERKFMGFTVSFPFGPKEAAPIGPVWLRGQDRWHWGLQTKVGEADNYITQGYGDIPRQRQGLWSDVTDHDRNGQADLQAQTSRLKRLLLQP